MPIGAGFCITIILLMLFLIHVLVDWGRALPLSTASVAGKPGGHSSSNTLAKQVPSNGLLSPPAQRPDLGSGHTSELRTDQHAQLNTNHALLFATTRHTSAQEHYTPPTRHSVEGLYRQLLESDDPVEKRNIRNVIAALQPSDLVFRFVLEQYQKDTNDAHRLQLQSIAAKTDVSLFPSKVVEIASHTADTSLFVSLVYALRRADTVSARKALMELAATCDVFSLEQQSGSPKARAAALHRCLLDSLQPSDREWINIYREANRLNTLQERILADYLVKSTNP